MPFKEHRGSGRGGSGNGDMPAIWDSEWSGTQADPEKCRTSQSWPYVQQLLHGANTVLEAGCGQGQWVKFLVDQGYDARGLDYSSVGIDRARANWPELADRYDFGDLREMPYDSEAFDAIVSFGAIEHNEDGIALPLQEMLRVLKPGGLLFCSVPCLNHVRRAGLMHLQDWAVRNRTIRKLSGRDPQAFFFEYVFTPAEYRAAIMRNGFEMRQLIPLGRMDIPLVGQRMAPTLNSAFARQPWALTHMMAAVATKPGIVDISDGRHEQDARASLPPTHHS